MNTKESNSRRKKKQLMWKMIETIQDIKMTKSNKKLTNQAMVISLIRMTLNDVQNQHEIQQMFSPLYLDMKDHVP